jgi:hypothetical protein
MSNLGRLTVYVIFVKSSLHMGMHGKRKELKCINAIAQLHIITGSALDTPSTQQAI